MAPGVFTRRQFASLIGAGTLCSSRALAAIVEVKTGSRLTPLADQTYVPPISLSTVADLYRRMTAPVRINGAGPFAFVVDTGANQSVLSEELAAQLGLRTGPLEPLNGVAGVENAATAKANLEVGGRAQADVVFSLLPAKAIGGVGMLGLDRLEGQELTLDFQGETLAIRPPRRLWRDPGDIAVKAHLRDGQLTLVDADLAGIPLVAFLDSGAQNTIGNMALRQLAVTRNPTCIWTNTPIVSATGQTIGAQMADLPQLRVGGMRLPNWPVAFADLHTFQMWDLTRKPAILLGVDVLSRFQSVCLDFARDEVRFRLPPRSW
ncbi:MAG: retroviral-like aspartic protease family protein [Pseudomonadota bacterium]|nr:retroviral-like aspartic protease family protein [Pseudomonadota bacterium]